MRTSRVRPFVVAARPSSARGAAPPFADGAPNLWARLAPYIILSSMMSTGAI